MGLGLLAVWFGLVDVGAPMSRVTIATWYGRVNSAWPEPVPQLTGQEATRALKRLYRFATGRKLDKPVEVTSGNRYSWPRYGVWYVNPEGHHRGGWRDLVHDLSHFLSSRELNPDSRPHSREHARLELKLVKEVLRRGWLDGSLKPKPPTLRVVTPETERELKIERRRKQVARLERRIKSLTTRLKTARRSLSALERLRGRP